jgi:nitroreductase
MDALDALLTRRSIRRYTDEPVTDEQVETLLRAAMAAPTAFNQRSWRFVVVRDPEVRTALSQASKYAGPLAAAPVAIVVCGDTRAEQHPGIYWVQDCTAALENLLTAANAMGLGAVWIGVHPWADRAAAVREAIGLPDGVEPLASVAVGHPAETKPPAQRYDPELVHAERWDASRPRGPHANEPGNVW